METVYFPPILRCLTGDGTLLSWSECLETLQDTEYDPSKNHLLESFFSDPHSISLLARPFEPYREPSAASQKSVSTILRTAADSLPATQKWLHDAIYDQLIPDTDWLAGTVAVDHSTALRCVLLAYIRQPAEQLMRGASHSVEDPRGTLSLLSHTHSTNGKTDPSQHEDDRRSSTLRLFYSERIALLDCAALLIETGSQPDDSLSRSTWVEKVAKTVSNAHSKGAQYDKVGKHFLVDCIDAVLRRVGELQDGPVWLASGQDFEPIPQPEWVLFQLGQTLATLNIVYIGVHHSKELLPSSVVLCWFRFLADVGFFELYQTEDSELLICFSRLQQLCALLSLAVLQLDLCLHTIFGAQSSVTQLQLDASSAYFLDSSISVELTSILASAAERSSHAAGPSLFGWVILLQSMRDAVSSASDDDFSHPDDSIADDAPSDSLVLYKPFNTTLDAVRQVAADRDLIGELAAAAVQNCQVYDYITHLAAEFSISYVVTRISDYESRMKTELLQLVSASLEYVEYQPDVVQSCLACLYFDHVSVSFARSELGALGLKMLGDPELRQKLLERARQRFPYEKAPFLQIATALLNIAARDSTVYEEILPIILQGSLFADQVPSTFSGYDLSEDGDELGVVVLYEDLAVETDPVVMRGSKAIHPKPQPYFNGQRGSDVLVIPSGTTGHVMSISKPLIVAWEFNFPLLGYVGLLLKNRRIDSNNELSLTLDLVSFLVALLNAASQQEPLDVSGSVVDFHSLLESIGALYGSKDEVAALVLQLLDQLIESMTQEPGLVSDEYEDLTSQGLRFASLLLEADSATIWPLFADGFLFGSRSRTSGLLEALMSRSSLLRKPSLLQETAEIYSKLVDSLISQMTPKKVLLADSGRWLDVREAGHARRPTGSSVSMQIKSDALRSATHMALDLLAALDDFSNLSPSIFLELTATIAPRLAEIVQLIFGTGSGDPDANPFSTVFASAALLVKHHFLGPEDLSHPSRRLIDQLNFAASTMGSRRVDQPFEDAVGSILRFVFRLVQLESQESRLHPLGSGVGRAVAGLAALYAGSYRLRFPVVQLLSKLPIWGEETAASQIGPLGSLKEADAAYFVAVLSNLDSPRRDSNLRVRQWALFEILVRHQVQWFASIIMVGQAASERVQRKVKAPAPYRTSLRSAWLRALTRLKMPAPLVREESQILHFVVSAASERPWAMRELSKEKDLKAVLSKRLGAYLVELANSHGTDESTASRRVHLLQICAHLFDLFAMDLHHWWQTGDKAAISAAKAAFMGFDYKCLSSSEYSVSLHANLKKNFEKKFPGLSSADFKRSPAAQTELGEDFFYDIDIAARLLGTDSSWTSHNGFLDSLIRANLNYSAVQAEVYLINSWSRMTTQLVDPSLDDQELLDLAVNMISQGLEALAQNQQQESVFDTLKQIQQRVVLANLHRLDQVQSTSLRAPSLLRLTWQALGESLVLDAGFSDADLETHHIALRSLIFALRFELRRQGSKGPGGASAKSRVGRLAADQEDKTAAMVSQMVQIVVLKAMKQTVVLLHESHPSLLTEELALLTLVIQTSLGFRNVSQYYSSISHTAVAEDTLRTITNLLTWSRPNHQADEPILGQNCTQLLLELSKIPQIAEQIAVQGILGLIASSDVMNDIRQGVDPVKQPVLFSIWVDELLPMLLNILTAVGKPVAQEVAAFLSSFRKQLQSSTALWDDPDVFTRSQVKQGYLVVLLGKIFENFELENVLDLPLDVQKATTGFLFLLEGRRNGLAGRLVATSPEEAALSSKTNENGSNRLEQVVYQELLELRLLTLGSENARDEDSRRSLRAMSLRA